MAGALGAWRELVREHDPDYQRKKREKEKRENEQKKRMERERFLTLSVMWPKTKLRGDLLRICLLSLAQQITTKHDILEVERLTVNGEGITIKFKEGKHESK
jgi:hypothetical protein